MTPRLRSGTASALPSAIVLPLFLVLLCAVPGPRWATCAESTIQGTVVNAPARIDKSSNIAKGKQNSAAHTSVMLKNSRVSSTLINSTQSKSTTNIAIGQQNRATQNSASIVHSNVKGTVVNSATAQRTSNIAAGNSNAATQGSVVLGTARINGVMLNHSEAKDSLNAAIGTGNSAQQGAIVVDENLPAKVPAPALQSGNLAAPLIPSLTNGMQPGNNAPGSSASMIGAPRKQGSPPAQQLPRHVPGQVVFLVDNSQAGLEQMKRIARKYNLNIGETTVLKSVRRIMVTSTTAKNPEEITEALKQESGVYDSQPNFIFETMGQEDPLSSMQNLASMLKLSQVHRKVSGKNITVAVVDTGVEIEHQDLRSRIIGHRNFIPDSSYRGEIHGTAVAGIIGAAKNEYGIIGLAPDVSLLAFRACQQINRNTPAGRCYSTSLAQSVDAAIAAGAHVVNLSLGAQVNDRLLSMMIDSGAARGIVFAAPVGNDPAADEIAFPASHRKVISIAGLDEQGNPLPNRKLAAQADAVAPATNLFVTLPGNNYNFLDGTSFASASISGIIALSMEKKIPLNRQNLPHFNSRNPWPTQVFSCIGF